MANRFARIRRDHATETAEDYVELIAALIEERGEARTVDIAARMQVSSVTVSKTLQRLIREGLVTSEPYRAVFLTDRGRDLAQLSRERHQIVVAFLRRLGVPAEVAEQDGEGIEHHVSAETLAAMQRHLAS